jgi:shikimate dehydrogenase
MTTRAISSTTALCLIIGDPVAHSLSPRMHNAAYEACGLDFVMAASRVHEGDLTEAISGVRALAIRGVAVTMPHKVSICPLLDELDPIAATIGAVNTIVNDSGHLKGYNTDWLGILRPLERHLSLRGKSVAILGAGGAAQAAAYACAQAGAGLTILNRTRAKAEQLAATYGASSGQLTVSSDITGFDVIINTSAVGMGSLAGQAPLSVNQLSSNQIVFETIYAPLETALVRNARSVGCTVILGYEMFLEQGTAQFELHTGQAAPLSAMREILESRCNPIRR